MRAQKIFTYSLKTLLCFVTRFSRLTLSYDRFYLTIRIMKYIIGNWKANKNEGEVVAWFEKFSALFAGRGDFQLSNITITVCVPFIYLKLAKNLKEKYVLPVEIGAQNVSPFANGAYTGEVSASQLKEYCDWVIIGHSERRKYFSESDELLEKKVTQATAVGLKTIYCIPDDNTVIPSQVTLAAYEPVWAIGTGKAESPEKAGQIISKTKNKYNIASVIYGGSVKADNVADFLKQKDISGVLPGGASLDPVSFWEMIVNAARIQA
jgi:triosephosphate isomerase (TIM)